MPDAATEDPISVDTLYGESDSDDRLTWATMRWLTTSTFLVAYSLAYVLPASADELTGKVIAVADGDTLTVLVSRKQIRVRLLDVDAPERKQAFGTRSRQSLAELCAGKDARVESKGEDRYGRTLGRVICVGTDANAEQVRRGMAWVFERYAPKDLPLYALQAEARAARRGLWADPRPVAPWEWRARRQSMKGI